MKKTRGMAWISTCAVMAIFLHGCQRDTSPTDFEVCMTNAEEQSACMDLLRFHVSESASISPRPPRYSYWGGSSFLISLPETTGVPTYPKSGKYEVTIRTGFETAEQRFERYVSVPWELPVNEQRGDLTVLSESERGEAGTALLAPANGDKRIIFFCLKPFRATAGNLYTDTGCTVRAELQRYVFVEYSVKYQSLQDWKRIHQVVVDQINEVMSIERTLQE